MKMMKYMTSIATALFALVACSDADDILSAYHNDPNAVHINAEVGKASADGFTRSNPLGKDADEQMKFNKDDEISVKADGQEAVTYRFDGSEWIPQDSKFLKWESESMTFTAYYPAASYSGGTIDQPQKYDNVASLAAADYMSFNDQIDKPKDNNALTLTMQRQMARVVVEVVGFNDQYASGTTVNSVTIKGVKAYKHGDGKFYALIKPCETPSSETFLSLEVGTGNTETLTGIPELVAGKSYTYHLTVGKNKVVVNGITVADWTTDKTINDVAKLDDRPYLTFTAAGAQKFVMTVRGGYDLSGKFEYSVNGGGWNKVVAGEGVDFGGPNSTLRLRGTNPKGTAESLSEYSKITFIEKNVKVACTGDIRTLLNHANYKNVATDQARFCYLFEGCAALTSAPALPAETLADDCYSFMFEHCTSLKTAPNLPATKLAKNCYFRMFNGCKSLETAPTLLAESLVSSCYGYMFMNCTNLKSAPELRATALALNCYQGMFQGCTSLETAPTLPATTLAIQCYNYMFMDCTNLTSVTMLAPSDQISTNRLSYWLEGAGTNAASRTLKVKDEAAYNALVNNSYLPARWKKDQCTVKNESGTPIE